MTSRFGIAVTLLGAALLVASSVGVSSVALERPIEVEVVDDGSAMVGFETNETNGNDSSGETLTVRNRVGTNLSVEVRPHSDIDVAIEAPETLGSGETGTISVADECEGDIEIDVTLRGTGVRIDRTTELGCGG